MKNTLFALFGQSKIKPSQIFWLFILLAWMVYFMWLWLNQYWMDQGNVFAGSIAAWADGSAHLSYAARFAYGHLTSDQLPVYSGQVFSYPFVADALTGLTTKLIGLPLIVSHQLWGMVLSIGLIYSLYWFYKLLFKSTSVSVLALSLYFLAGGLGGYYFVTDSLSPTTNQGYGQFIPRQYTHLPELNIELINTISGQLLPQRALLLGLIIGLVILAFLWKVYQESSLVKVKDFVVAGALMGLLPIIHPHTLIYVTGFVGWVFLLTWKLWKKWLAFLIPAGLIGIILLFRFILPTTSQASFISWQLGWLAGEKGINSGYFWLLNWGVFLPFSLWAYINSTRAIKIFWLPSWGFFILANLIVFQPNIWDNSKIFTWIYLSLSGILAYKLILLSNKRKALAYRLVVIWSIICLIFSGTLDAIRLLEFKPGAIHMFDTQDLLLAEHVKSVTAPDSVFLTSDLHNHTIPTLTGRQIIMGYRGWLWTYGIDYRQREAEIATIYRAGDNYRSLIDRYGIDYVVVGPDEKAKYQVNLYQFNQDFPTVYMSDKYIVFAVSD